MTRRKIYGPDRDSVSRHVGEPLLDRALRGLLKPGELQLLKEFVHGLHPDQIARKHGTTASIVESALAGIFHKIKESPHSDALLEDLRSRGGPRFSSLLWEGRSEVPVVHRCARETCAKLFDQPSTGRARKFCSNACRQAVYRDRRRAERSPDCQGARSVPLADARRGFRLRKSLPEPPAPRGARGSLLRYLNALSDRIGRSPAPATGAPVPGRSGAVFGWVGSGKTNLLVAMSLLVVDGQHRLAPMTSLWQLIHPPATPECVLRPEPSLTSPLHAQLPVPDGRAVPCKVVPFPGAAMRYEAWSSAPGTGPVPNRRDKGEGWSRRGQRYAQPRPGRGRSRR
ncbi:hypothetical protein GCM10010254_75920 [Streptomyces chromofuscus]|nr:hypothetical protein GCM10010254_75920 [Streptomyces chromofuscus]